jgi:acetyl-CoA carboxylase carboxyltransferase component
MSEDEQNGWGKEVDEIARRRELAREMGGEKSVARQHAAGKLTVRERIESICDKGSFRERGGRQPHGLLARERRAWHGDHRRTPGGRVRG